jgi:hypothetical protein
MLKNNYNYVPYLFLGLWMLWGFGLQTLYGRLMIDVHGTIVNVVNAPKVGESRYISTYTIRSEDGRDTVYVAGPTDRDLPRNMPVGTKIKKNKWHLDFEKNGVTDTSFSKTFYFLFLIASVGMVVWCGFKIVKK